MSLSLYKEIIKFSSLLEKYGHHKQASEVLSYAPPIKSLNTLYKGQPGSVAPILQLSKILEKIKKSNLFQFLPENVIKGLLKIEKMTDDAFKFANQKNAFLFDKSSPLEKMKNYLDKLEYKINFSLLPEKIINSFNKLKSLIDLHLSKELPEEKVKEKLQKTPTTEKSPIEEKLLSPKTKIDEKKLKEFESDVEKQKTQSNAIRTLKKNLNNLPVYKEIFYKLPPNIIKELQKIGLDPDNLSLSTKYANSILPNLLLNNTYKKNAIDFSNINNLLQSPKKLNDREISRSIRLALAAELDAIHLYELIADSSNSIKVKKVLQNIADEEKVHVGELQELLKYFDNDNNPLLLKGIKETQSLLP